MHPAFHFTKPAAANAAYAAKCAVCAMARAQQKAKAKTNKISYNIVIKAWADAPDVGKAEQ